MSTINIDHLIRANIRDLVPYSSARSEYTDGGKDMVYLDANENSFGSSLGADYNRYPDPLQLKLKEVIATIKSVDKGSIFLGNGSDEPIDLLIRSFCEPGIDNLIILPPTYGMYEVSAKINNVTVKEVRLTDTFQVNVLRVINAVDEHTKMIFICSPNNPTANLIETADIIDILENFSGIVVLDEAYIDFSAEDSLLKDINEYPNLVILQTFSKAWGLAGLRLGMAFASPEIISVLNKVKAPYNINLATQTLALEALKEHKFTKENTAAIIQQRAILEEAISELPFVVTVYPSDANFILIKVDNAANIYNYLKSNGIIVRNRSSVPGCENCLRITVGTANENERLITTLKAYTHE